MSIIQEDREQYKETFNYELGRLNEQQRHAVNKTEGPVLVVAGPGTGKTQILAARIGRILEDGLAEAHNILCLTYTDAGVIAMRKRLLQFIGPDAYNVHIYTFHAFCNQVIQENIDLFADSRELRPVSELELIDVFRKILDDLPKNHPFKRLVGDVYFEQRRLGNLFDLMKKENWKPDDIHEAVDEYLESLHLRPKFQYKRKYTDKAGTIHKAGAPKKKDIDAETQKMNRLKDAASLFDKYQEALHDIQRYDYNDMILWVLEKFRDEKSETKESDLLISYQERYHYFLVDEYQDTNGAQNSILSFLTDYWDEANVFVVGDDDQSIFRFQGANMTNIIDYYHKHRDFIDTIVLENNYRSTQHILDASKVLIEHNQERLLRKLSKDLPSLTKDLVALGDNAESELLPKITCYYNTAHEEADILKRIIALQEQGINLNDVAIIYRSHAQVENLVKIMERKQIPLNIKQRVNILTLPFVKNLITILRYIHMERKEPNSPEAERLLFEIMHYSYFGIDPRDIARIAFFLKYRLVKEVTDENIDPVTAQELEEEEYTWRDILADEEKLQEIGVNRSLDALQTLERNLNIWTQELSNMTLQMLFEKILTRGKILEMVMNSSERIWLMQVLTTFFDFIKDESAKSPALALNDLLEMLDKMEHHDIAVSLNKILHSEEGVNFVTAHSSKGLEFDYVFMVGCNSHRWEKKRAPQSTFKMPDTIIESNPENKEEDERRLFYVGMTRAKKGLFLSYAARQISGKDLEASRFVEEVLLGTTLSVQPMSLSDDDIFNFHMKLLQSDDEGTLDLIDKNLIEHTLKNFKMSVTNLNKYLKCPLTYYFENILRIPTARGVHTGFGNAIHYALENYFKEKKRNDKFGSKLSLLDIFRKGMAVYRSHFTDKEFEDRTAYGEQILPLYHDKYGKEWKGINDFELEYAIRNAQSEGVPISGKLDKVEILENNVVNVVDYKTGKFENAREKLKRPDEKNPLGGDYWRQIVFYKILLDADKRNSWEMTSGEMDFVQPDNRTKSFSKAKLMVTPEDVTLVKSQLSSTYESIKRHEFNGCNEEDCQWCNFVKANFKADVLNLISTDEDEEKE